MLLNFVFLALQNFWKLDLCHLIKNWTAVQCGVDYGLLAFACSEHGAQNNHQRHFLFRFAHLWTDWRSFFVDDRSFARIMRPAVMVRCAPRALSFSLERCADIINFWPKSACLTNEIYDLFRTAIGTVPFEVIRSLRNLTWLTPLAGQWHSGFLEDTSIAKTCVTLNETHRKLIDIKHGFSGSRK